MPASHTHSWPAQECPKQLLENYQTARTHSRVKTKVLAAKEPLPPRSLPLSCRGHVLVPSNHLAPNHLSVLNNFLRKPNWTSTTKLEHRMVQSTKAIKRGSTAPTLAQIWVQLALNQYSPSPEKIDKFMFFLLLSFVVNLSKLVINGAYIMPFYIMSAYHRWADDMKEKMIDHTSCFPTFQRERGRHLGSESEISYN